MDDNINNRLHRPRRPRHPVAFTGPLPWVPAWMVPAPTPSFVNHRPQPYNPQDRAGANLDPYQMSYGGGPLSPNPVTHSYTLPYPNNVVLPRQSHWSPTPHSTQTLVPPNQDGMMNMASGLAYEQMTTAMGYQLHPAESNPTMRLPAANTGFEANNPAQNMYLQQPGNVPTHYYVAMPLMQQAVQAGRVGQIGQIGQMGPNPHPAASTTSNRRLTPARVPRMQNIYSASSPPPHHDFSGTPIRRSSYSSRARRLLPLNARPVASGSLNEDTEERDGSNSNVIRLDLVEDRASLELAIAAQGVSGSVHKIMSHELFLLYSRSIKVEDLPEDERECAICYNQFGTKSPEGLKESPRQLPKCKHVFGDRCLNTWLELSESCPYCRDRLRTPQIDPSGSGRARAYIAIMRGQARVQPIGPARPQPRHTNLLTAVTNDEGEVGEAQGGAVLQPPLRRGGGSDSSAESTPSDSSSGPVSPIRGSLRDASRWNQWSSRALRGNRRQRGARSDPSPSQPLRSDRSTQSSPTFRGINATVDESSQRPADAGDGRSETSVTPAASTPQNRNRPW